MKESELLEFKSSFSLHKEIIKTLSAFANKHGGTILVGLNDRGELSGMEIGKKTIEDFVVRLRQYTDPVLYPSITNRTFGLGEIVEITIKESEQKPVLAFQKAFTRVGKATIQMSNAEMRDLFKKNQYSGLEEANSRELIEEFVFPSDLNGFIRKKNPDFQYLEFLTKHRLLIENALSAAAYLCFTNENNLFYNAMIRVARFKGNDEAVFIDSFDYKGPLLMAAEDIMKFIKRHIKMRYEINPGEAHSEVWEYPLKALHEAIVNAVVHRDYADPGQILIKIFDDNLQICSPGLLPNGMNPEDIMQGPRSVPRNRKIAEVFYALGFIESWGSGIPRIIKETKEHGGIEVEMKHLNGAFLTVFKHENTHQYSKVSESVHGSYVRSTGSHFLSNYSTLNKRQRDLYLVIVKHPGMKAKELSALLGLSSSTVGRYIMLLISNGLIIRKGSRKSGGYFACE